jgi:hypothetical protein
LGVDIPQPFVSSISGSLGSVGPVTVAGSLGAIGPVTVAGIPDNFHIFVEKLPKIQLGVDPVTLTLNPVDVNLSLKEFPSIRGHLPADFCIGFSIFGIELMSVRLCGEAQIITEPYVANPCEVCGPGELPSPAPVPNPTVPGTPKSG